MYRCYILRDGHIHMRVDPDLAGVDEAIACCRTVLATHEERETLNGFEVWRGVSLIYSEIAAAGGMRQGRHPGLRPATEPLASGGRCTAAATGAFNKPSPAAT